ncbi:MAG: NosD domain-containing protein [archaeon]
MKHHSSGFNRQIMIGVVLVILAIGAIVFLDTSTKGDATRFTQREQPPTSDRFSLARESQGSPESAIELAAVIRNQTDSTGGDLGTDEKKYSLAQFQGIEEPAEEECVTLTDGMVIKETPIICVGTVKLSQGVIIETSNEHPEIVLDCSEGGIQGTEGSRIGIQINSKKPTHTVTIRNCHISGYGDAILSYDPVIANIEYNKIDSGNGVNSIGGMNGIRFIRETEDDSGTLSPNVRIIKNQLYNLKTNVVVRNSKRVEVSLNTISHDIDKGTWGIKLRNASSGDEQSYVVGNDVSGVKYGLLLRNTSKVEVSSNKFSSPPTQTHSAGIIGKGKSEKNTIIGNRVHKFGLSVLLEENTNQWMIAYNDFLTGNDAGYQAVDYSKNKNMFYNPSNSIGNYWNDYKPGHNPAVLLPYLISNGKIDGGPVISDLFPALTPNFPQ